MCKPGAWLPSYEKNVVKQKNVDRQGISFYHTITTKHGEYIFQTAGSSRVSAAINQEGFL